MAMLALVAMIAMQAAAPPSVPQRFSILAPQTCRRDPDDADIVVCDSVEDSARLPLPDDRGPPDHAVPSNPNRTGIGALAASSTPCAATQWGCQVGFGPPIAPIVNAAVGLVKSALAKKPDKTGRVDIPLDDPPLKPLEP
jgi:hypothetical protein